jgi:hypothetical protein
MTFCEGLPLVNVWLIGGHADASVDNVDNAAVDAQCVTGRCGRPFAIHLEVTTA